MLDRPSRLRSPAGRVGVLLVAMVTLAAACGGGPAGKPIRSTLDDVADVSLTPARQTGSPAAVQSAQPAPSAAPPSGEPQPPPAPVAEYTTTADDLAAFVAAYRSAFPEPALTDESIGRAGAVACTYLMRHADAGGTVAVDDAVREADLGQPGYAAEDWLTAFRIASDHYCGAFAVDIEGAGE